MTESSPRLAEMNGYVACSDDKGGNGFESEWKETTGALADYGSYAGRL